MMFTLIQGAIHWLKSLWDLKIEIDYVKGKTIL
jgi:hypothetical protein